MLPPLSPPVPVDLDALSDYLLSDRSPPECMDLSQLDGFLAGVLTGPEMIVPSEFLPVVWGGGQPDFVDAAEAATILGSILGRYNEIAGSLEAAPPDYAPVFWQDAAGNAITEDWAVGFMQAVALRSDAWEPALHDDETAMLLIPIGIIAGLAEPEIGLHDATLPDGFLDELMERAADLLPACVLGLRAFWTDRAGATAPGRASGRKRRH
ncbi:MAG TPA: UPF0149 family protein [Acetobacteraceae bacterium]|nr:UPF0149 family protein [Acetobacteraceae bacterium]